MASPIWVVRLPATSPQQAKNALAGDPDSPLAHDDKSKRREFPPAKQQRACRGHRFCAAQLESSPRSQTSHGIVAIGKHLPRRP
jgi:hypothetical protein